MRVDINTDSKDLGEKSQRPGGVVVVDAPRRHPAMMLKLFEISKLVLVPITASRADFWSIRDLLAMRDKAKPNLDVRLIWNMARPYIGSEAKLISSIKNEYRIKFLKSNLRFRVAYKHALAEGLSVPETGPRGAKTEVDNLVKEVEAIVG